ncbi:MAG: adenylate kinase family protein [Nitrososphaerota archaeon]
MYNVILLTGTPGSGKTLIGEKLAKNLEGVFIDIPTLVKKKKLFSYYDRKYRSYIVNLRKLREELNKIYKMEERKIVISSHFPIYIPKEKLCKVIVLRCNPLILIKRLKKRKYPYKKIRDNIVSELIDLIYYEAIKYYGKKIVFQLDVSNKKISEILKEISLILLKNGKQNTIDWISSLEKMGKLDFILKYIERKK